MTDNKTDVRAGCSVKAAPVPIETTCKECGADVEMWSDETDVTCGKCGAVIRQEA